jgi:hypothetical protein
MVMYRYGHLLVVVRGLWAWRWKMDAVRLALEGQNNQNSISNNEIGHCHRELYLVTRGFLVVTRGVWSRSHMLLVTHYSHVNCSVAQTPYAMAPVQLKYNHPYLQEAFLFLFAGNPSLTWGSTEGGMLPVSMDDGL